MSCQCGCGEATQIATVTCRRDGTVRGQPRRFVKGHNARRSLAEKFWEKVDVRGPDECWPWLGCLMKKTGYGALSHRQVTLNAHRVAYELAVGPIPEGLVIDHVKARGCTRRDCVNPAHLEPVTNAENSVVGLGRDESVSLTMGQSRSPRGSLVRPRRSAGRKWARCSVYLRAICAD